MSDLLSLFDQRFEAGLIVRSGGAGLDTVTVVGRH